MSKVYLIGLPGSGKTSLGKKLAIKLKYKFFDMDEVIERQEKKSVKKIILENGLDHFRKLETKLLLEIQNLDNLVISTGGGIVETSKNKDLLKGNIIYLKKDPEKISLSQAEIDKRPLLSDNTLSGLYQKRDKLYIDFSTIIIDSNDKNQKEIIKEILENENFSY